MNMREVYVGVYTALALVAVVVFFVLLLADPLAALLWFVVATLAVVLVLVNSTHVVGPDEMIAVFFTGTFEYVYVTEKYFERYWRSLTKQWDETGLDEDEKAEEEERVRTTVRIGLFRSDYIFVLWVPLFVPWTIYRFPVGTIKIPVHASRVYTKNDPPHYPRVRLQMTATIQMSLAPQGIGQLVESISTLLQQGTNNLLKSAELLAAVLHGQFNELVQQALRDAAQNFTWTGDHDIVGKDALKSHVKLNLCKGDSIFVQAGLLAPHGEQPNVTAPVPAGRQPPRFKYGPGALAFDLVIGDIRPQPAATDESEFSKAIDAPMIGELQGRQKELLAKLEREGVAAGLKKIATELGLQGSDQAIVMIAERLQQANIHVFDMGQGGAALLDAVRRAMGSPPQQPTHPPSNP